MSKTFDKWMKRAQDSKTPWTEQDIIYFRKYLNTTCQDFGQKADLMQEFHRAEAHQITAAQSEKGRQYLLNKSLKLNGERRKGCKLGERELDILRDPGMTHQLVGLWDVSRHGSLTQYVPVYRAISSEGLSFDYLGVTYELLEVVG